MCTLYYMTSPNSLSHQSYKCIINPVLGINYRLSGSILHVPTVITFEEREHRNPSRDFWIVRHLLHMFCLVHFFCKLVGTCLSGGNKNLILFCRQRNIDLNSLHVTSMNEQMNQASRYLRFVSRTNKCTKLIQIDQNHINPVSFYRGLLHF